MNLTKHWGEPRCSGRVSSSCSTSDTRRVTLITNPVISHERGKEREVPTDKINVICAKYILFSPQEYSR
jgi:hypothetical protein